MKSKRNSINQSLILASLLVSLILPLSALSQDIVRIGRQGRLNFDTDVRVGETLLKKGYYQIRHVVTGADHVIVFTKLVHPPEGLSMGDWRPGKEVRRMKCKVEPLGETAKYGGVRFGTNTASEKTIEEVHIKGENVKHIF